MVTPVIDLIDDSTFRYGASPLVRGAFNWALTFKWRAVSRLERRTRETDAVSSPAMAGGLFAIHRKWFIELGTSVTALPHAAPARGRPTSSRSRPVG